MDNYPKISVVTICYNMEAYLEATILSIVGQGYPHLEYIIIDGGSEDGTIDIIRKYEEHLAYWVSEPDEGLVDALQKGLAKTTGSIMAWLNADDVYFPKSLFAVAQIFSSLPKVHWIIGQPSWYNQKGVAFNRMYDPKSHHLLNRYLSNDTFYDLWARWSKVRYFNRDFLAVQQESTFWRRSLWDQAGGQLDDEYKLAFDLELWCRFFRHQPLYTVEALLSGFRYRIKDQKSFDQLDAYLKEGEKAIDREWSNMSFSMKIVTRIKGTIGRLLMIAVFLNVPLLKSAYFKVMGIVPKIRYDEFRQTFYLKK